MPERKTVGQLMEEMRLKAGAQNYHGHEYIFTTVSQLPRQEPRKATVSASAAV